MKQTSGSISSFSSYFQTRKFILFLSLLYTIIIDTVMLHRFWQYEAFYYDHGMYESTAYQISHFTMPLHDRGSGKVPIYVDHLYPSMQVVLAPFYWIWDSYETPIVVMAIFIGLSVLVGYEIGRKTIKNTFMIYTLLIAYMFYIGMQNAIVFLIHEVTVGILFLMLLFWAIVYKKIKLYYLFLILNLGFKETLSVFGVFLGIALLFYDRTWRKHAAATVLISVIYGFLASRVIIPFFQYTYFGSSGGYMYAPEITFRVQDYITRLFDTNQKRETLFTSLSSFGFLPLFSPFSFLIVFQDFFQRFSMLSPGMSDFRQGLNLHYNASLSVLLYIGSLFGVKHLERIKKYRSIEIVHALAILCLVFYYHRIYYHGPLGLIYNKDFFSITKNMKFMDNFVSRIPTTGKIMTQNNLAVRFSHNNIYILSSIDYLKKVNPDVVAIDSRPGQNPNNFWPLTEVEVKELAEYLILDKSYTILYQEDPYRYIFVRKNHAKN